MSNTMVSSGDSKTRCIAIVQLDDAEVRPEVATGARDLVDEERADLGGELVGLARGEPAHVGRGADLVEQTHGGASSSGVRRRCRTVRTPKAVPTL